MKLRARFYLFEFSAICTLIALLILGTSLIAALVFWLPAWLILIIWGNTLRCPQYRKHVNQITTSGLYWFGFWPERKCSRCGLDLTTA
jgi:hypothetical protein